MSLFPNSSHVNPNKSRCFGLGCQSQAREGRDAWGGPTRNGARRVFLSTFEKQLDSKAAHRRAAGFPRPGGRPIRAAYSAFPPSRPTASKAAAGPCSRLVQSLIEELPLGDPLRTAAGDRRLRRHARAVLRHRRPHHPARGLCDAFGLTDWVALVGLGDRFQIWEREAFRAHRAEQRQLAREGLPPRACSSAQPASEAPDDRACRAPHTDPCCWTKWPTA